MSKKQHRLGFDQELFLHAQLKKYFKVLSKHAGHPRLDNFVPGYGEWKVKNEATGELWSDEAIAALCQKEDFEFTVGASHVNGFRRRWYGNETTKGTTAHEAYLEMKKEERRAEAKAKAPDDTLPALPEKHMLQAYVAAIVGKMLNEREESVAQLLGQREEIVIKLFEKQTEEIFRRLLDERVANWHERLSKWQEVMNEWSRKVEYRLDRLGEEIDTAVELMHTVPGSAVPAATATSVTIK